MSALKKLFKSLPVAPAIYRGLRNMFYNFQLGTAKNEEVFTKIYNENTWGGTESVSGRGSDDDQTVMVVKELSAVLNEFSVRTMLDIPCGDFYWMKNIDLSSIDYIGADIVEALISKNTEQFCIEGVRFQKLNLIKDQLLKVDLIFCRDCLVHLSFDEIFHALNNICNSNSEFLLTTTFPEREHNDDIESGEWRTLNLEIAPYMLPKPLKIIDEKCTTDDGIYTDKSLGLWKISDIRESLNRS